MHELALAESVVATVLERTGDQHVTVIRLRVGQLAGVVPDALTFCFELAAAGTPLAGVALEIEDELGRSHCRSCGADFTMHDRLPLCGCGSADVQLLSGRELTIASVDVA